MRNSSGQMMAQRLSLPGRSEAAEHSQLLLRVRPCEKPSPMVTVHDREAKVEVALDTGHHSSPGSSGAPTTTTLHFDKVFREDQQELFAQLQPALLACLGGASCTVLAHGGPQSGKSFALSGLFTSGETHGIAPRAIQVITEEIERMTGSVPAVEASFFELQQDAVCDLLSASAPRVAMRETTQPPFVALDQHLTAMKCDGASGFNRLLDAYFTGLEHRRKGNHTCFQITFTRGNRKRSYLRLIEMVWPRPQAGKNPGAGKASVALEQVLQSKLSGSSCGYRGAPLALLLKPCLEGASSLCFIHCLRLEQAHLSQLVTAAPLLTKIFQWMSNERKLLNKNKHTEGSPPPPRQSRGPVVPPLHLDAHLGSTGGSCTLSTEPLEDVDGVTATSGADPTSASGASSDSNTRRSPSKSAPMVGATSEDTVTGGEGGTGEASAGVKHLLSDSTEEEDCQVNKLIAQLLQVKRRTVEALEQDARCSSGAFQELDSLLGHIMSTREAHGSGPDERETNLKLVYEQVYRSIQRSTEEVSKIRHEIQELESFCRKGYIPPLYDAYSASQQDIQKMKDMQQAASRVTEEKEEAKGKLNISVPWAVEASPQVIEIPQLPLSCLQGDPSDGPLPQPYIEGTASASSSSGSSSSSAPGTDVRRASFTAGYTVPVVAPPTGHAGLAGHALAVNPPSWAQAMKDPTPGTIHKAPPLSITPPMPMAFSRLPGAGSPLLPYRPVTPPVGSVKVAPKFAAGLTAVASESKLGMQASPPRFHTNGRCTVQGPGGGSMTVGPGAGMMCQIGSPLQAFRTTSPNKTAAVVSPMLMTRTLQAPPVPQHAVAAVAAQTMPQGIGTIPGMLPARVMTQAASPGINMAPGVCVGGASPPMALRNCRTASDLTRPMASFPHARG